MDPSPLAGLVNESCKRETRTEFDPRPLPACPAGEEVLLAMRVVPIACKTVIDSPILTGKIASPYVLITLRVMIGSLAGAGDETAPDCATRLAGASQSQIVKEQRTVLRRYSS